MCLLSFRKNKLPFVIYIWLGIAWMSGIKFVYGHYLDQQLLYGKPSEEQIAKNKEHAKKFQSSTQTDDKT